MSNEESSGLLKPVAAGRPPLALIAGPTASGKSDCAVLLAQALQQKGREAVIVNADSAQVYRDLSILSARPTEADMQGIAHVLFGSWDGAHACSAADWAAAARREIAAAHTRDAVPILVGGTGLYMRTLLDGIAPVSGIDPAIREAVRAMPVTEAHAALAREDPQRAARLAPADTARITRALEVVRSTGRTLSDWQDRREGGIGDAVSLHPLILLPDRAQLYARCDARFATMVDRGAVAEVRALLARDLAPDLPVMRAIGVPEIGAYLRDECTLGEANAAAAQATRNYAKRQFTWFRRQPPDDWPRVEITDYKFTDLRVILYRTFGLT
ncbi:tRNA (adenosine(37)-N6)-dimethylallyltransferase MiaA [Novosphingobium aquimarinum]|uniref:tRNA (adenosine(37)-N6)-dimethylallyltransferase MiaA n=1 Tax=Novosphingobium aquimarinum TaxID=2682494 RepID=UPI0012EB8793|nr:tRNA (adenosine(37)-N6)-dimethylallyltransferase MiaA [Novosphingobium aquimarinum]